MTLDEMIAKATKDAEILESATNGYPDGDEWVEEAKKHRQLAELLKELKAYRDTYKNYSKVEKMLICEVEKANENPSVKKPISYGLYQTWKFWDKNEVVREVNADE